MFQNNFFKENSRYSVWSGYQEEMPASRSYNMTLSVALLAGFAINAFLCKVVDVEVLSENIIFVLIGYFVLTLAGSFIMSGSHTMGMALLGYGLIVVPVGVVLSVIVNGYNQHIVFNAMLGTGIITGAMMVVSFMWPESFLRLGRTLGIMLLLSIIADIALSFILGNMEIIDYIIIVIFSLYVGYDFARAQTVEKTPVNAIKSAASLYLDIINIFVRIMSILGRGNRRN